MRVQLQTNQERVRDAKERQSGADEEIENLTAHMEELAARRESLDETAQREGLSRVLEELNGKTRRTRRPRLSAPEPNRNLKPHEPAMRI